MTTLPEFQHSTRTHRCSVGFIHDTPNYWLSSHHESLSHEQECPSSFPCFLPTCNTFIFMYTSNCITLPLGQTTDNLKGSSLPSQAADLEAQSLPFLNHRHSSPATQKGDPRERLQLSWALGGECEGHKLPEPPSTLVSQVLRFLQRTQGRCGDQSSKGATKPPREKKLFCLHKIELNRSGQICTLKNAIICISTTLRRNKKYI